MIRGKTVHSKESSKVSIRIRGEEELKARFDAIEAKAKGQAGRAIVAAGAVQLEGQIKVNIDARFGQGNIAGLKNSVATSVELSGPPVAYVEANKEYARIQEFGGTVRPVEAKALHWVQDGKHIFAKSVTLPARPYFRPAIRQAEGNIRQAMLNEAEVYLIREE